MSRRISTAITMCICSPQIYPIVAAFAREKGIALRIDRQVAAQSGLDQQAARSSAGFSSAFYGEAVSEELFLQTLDASIARGERSLEVMCHPAYVDRIIMEQRLLLSATG